MTTNPRWFNWQRNLLHVDPTLPGGDTNRAWRIALSRRTDLFAPDYLDGPGYVVLRKSRHLGLKVEHTAYQYLPTARTALIVRVWDWTLTVARERTR